MKIIKTNFVYTKALIPLNLDKVMFIVLHHPDAKKATPEDIHQWHLDRGFNGFGYNEYIRKDGTVYIGRGDHIGAQCENMNSKSYGICCEGDYDSEKDMPEAQFKALIERLQFHRPRFKNLVAIEPHSKFKATACPGKYYPLQEVYDALNDNKTPQEFYAALDKLTQLKIINTPKYWLDNAKVGQTIKGEFAAALIIKAAKALKG